MRPRSPVQHHDQRPRADLPGEEVHSVDAHHHGEGKIALRAERRSIGIADLLVVGLVGAAVAAIVSFAREFRAPYLPAIQIDLLPRALPRYVLYSLVRGVAALAISYLFAFAFGLAAASSRAAAARAAPGARHPAVDPRARLPAGTGARPGGALPRAQHRARARRHPDDLHRPGVEPRAGLLSIARLGARAAAGGVSARRVAPLGHVPATRSAGGGPGADLERHALDGGRMVLPDGERVVSRWATTTSGCRGSAPT